jgi:beta-lactamase regulating signal transducer with metallopeptidase domain
MHILLNMSAMLVVTLLGSALVLQLMRFFDDWSKRQGLQLLILVTPLICLIVLIGGLQHVLNPDCAVDVPTWDALVDRTVLLLLGSSLVGALGLGVGRLLLMQRVMGQQAVLSDPDLQALVDRFARQSHLARPCVQLARSDRPFAVLYGIRRPTIVLSTWMVEHLDAQELEAVLVHELAHIRRHHYLLNWIALILRDAFFYLPTSRIAYRQFHYEKELVCDELVVQATRRPLALASALTKVWLYLVDDPASALVQTLLGKGESISGRVDRLLSMRRPIVSKQPLRFSSLSISTFISIAVLNVTVGLALTVALLHC